MLACLPMVCQSTRSTGESGRTARDTDAKSWLRRGLRRAKRCLGVGGWVRVCVCMCTLGRCRWPLGVHSVLEVHQTCVEADKTIPSGPEPSCLAARCSLLVMATG